MKKQPNEVRITITLNAAIADKFSALTHKIGVSGTALLSSNLPDELKYLSELPANSERGESAYRLVTKFNLSNSSSRRLNITLKKDDADRMVALCDEKRVPRDNFIQGYINFLVNGEEGICEAPLETVSGILADPRRQYKRKRATTGTENENPYEFLHFDELTLQMIESLPGILKGGTV